MYNVNCVENGIIVDSLGTEDIKEIEKFFNKNRCFMNLNNSMTVIRNMGESESFKFYKSKNDRNKYIEVHA